MLTGKAKSRAAGWQLRIDEGVRVTAREPDRGLQILEGVCSEILDFIRTEKVRRDGANGRERMRERERESENENEV
jgi:hypothetical protein